MPLFSLTTAYTESLEVNRIQLTDENIITRPPRSRQPVVLILPNGTDAEDEFDRANASDSFAINRTYEFINNKKPRGIF